MPRDDMRKRLSDAAMKFLEDVFSTLFDQAAQKVTGALTEIDPTGKKSLKVALPIELFDRQTAAKACSVSPSTIDRWRREGRLKAVYPNGSATPMFTKRAVQKFIRDLEKE